MKPDAFAAVAFDFAKLGVGATPTAARAALTMSGEAAITARGRAVALWC